MASKSNAHDNLAPDFVPRMPDCKCCSRAWAQHRASDDLCPFQDEDTNVDSFYTPEKNVR